MFLRVFCQLFTNRTPLPYSCHQLKTKSGHHWLEFLQGIKSTEGQVWFSWAASPHP